MSVDSLYPLLLLLFFYLLALLFFTLYFLFILKRKGKKFFWPDIAIWSMSIISWGGGFFLSDRYGIGFGKTLSNIFELFFIGILTFIYVAIRVIYVECMKLCWGTAFITYFFWSIIVLALLVGLFFPGIPE